MEDLFRIGVITSTHGLKGEVKVFPTTDDVNRFKKLKKCYIYVEKTNEYIEVEKNTCKFFKNMVILSFKEFKDINEVEKYRQCELYVTREDAIPLEEDEYYFKDVIGMDIVLEDETKIGILDDILQTGANDVFVVKMDNKKELLIPVIKDCVLKIDYDAEQITVRLMKGMLD